jgi:hypothetical protein
MGLFGFGGSRQKWLVVVSCEGPGHFRLNANRERHKRMKQNAASHSQTVCWIEFSQDGARTDQGEGPAAGRLGSPAVERLLRDLPQSEACRHVLEGLRNGRDRCSHSMQWTAEVGPVRGSMDNKRRAKPAERPASE